MTSKERREKIEGIARAICLADGGDPDRITGYPAQPGEVTTDIAISEWQNYIPSARAAFEELAASPVRPERKRWTESLSVDGCIETRDPVRRRRSES